MQTCMIFLLLQNTKGDIGQSVNWILKGLSERGEGALISVCSSLKAIVWVWDIKGAVTQTSAKML